MPDLVILIEVPGRDDVQVGPVLLDRGVRARARHQLPGQGQALWAHPYLLLVAESPDERDRPLGLAEGETEIIMPAMSTDLLSLVLSCFDGSLKDYNLYFNTDYFVDVVLVSGGYPQAYTKGYEIEGLENLSEDTILFHAGTKRDNNIVLSNGGRVLNVICHDSTLRGAIKKVYNEVEKIHFPDIFYRTDIGNRKRK